ncbi:MAG: protein translocase subunit SecD [Paenibacillaceae bacterium]|nr:protein translocase subunit SecD [Paenibacillaceae bacterium]
MLIAFTVPGLLDNVRLGLDLKGGFEILYEAEPVQAGGTITPDNLRQTARSLEKRVNALGTAEPEIWTEGTNRIRVRLAGVTDEAKVRELLKKPAELTVRGPDGSVELYGTDFKEGGAKVGYDELHRPYLLVEVKEKTKLEQLSSRLLGQTIRFQLDDRLLTDPVVQAVMTNGLCRITGNFSPEEAKELVDIINMGALPLKLTEKFSQSVGASLGKLSLQMTLQAGAAGSLLILLFVLALYRLPGLVAAATLITYSWLLLVCLYLLQATMTLPGIAAFVLGIGMAVDANIIHYERLKEELRTGLSLLSAHKAGAKRSFRTIMDANVTTLIAGAVLYTLGSGAIKGFAVTLILSIVLSIATNVFFSQWLLQLLVRSDRFRSMRWFGVNPADRPNPAVPGTAEPMALPRRTFDFVGKSKRYFMLSLLLTAIGIASLLIRGLNYGVDFKAGTALDLTLSSAITAEQAERIVLDAGYEPSVLSIAGTAQDRVSMRFDTVLDPSGADISRIVERFAQAQGPVVGVEANTVDPEIARELARQAMLAVAVASLGILLYVMFRFEWRFAASAIVALLHDVFFVISLFSLFRLEVNLPFIAAMLTIIGYSINDTVVIFDRIRENLRFARAQTSADLTRIVNASINQTLARSVNTVVAVLFASVALLVWGSESIRLFSLAMTVGLVVGMYSSIFIASQLWLLLKKRSLKAGGAPSASEQSEKQYELASLQTVYEDEHEPLR